MTISYYAAPGLPEAILTARPTRTDRNYNLSDIITAACDILQVDKQKVASQSRKWNLCFARYQIISFIRDYFDTSFVNSEGKLVKACKFTTTAIAAEFDRDHTSTIHAVKIHRQLMDDHTQEEYQKTYYKLYDRMADLFPLAPVNIYD